MLLTKRTGVCEISANSRSWAVLWRRVFHRFNRFLRGCHSALGLLEWSSINDLLIAYSVGSIGTTVTIRWWHHLIVCLISQKLLAILICTLNLPDLMRINEFLSPMEFFYLGLVSKGRLNNWRQTNPAYRTGICLIWINLRFINKLFIKIQAFFTFGFIEIHCSGPKAQ